MQTDFTKKEKELLELLEEKDKTIAHLREWHDRRTQGINDKIAEVYRLCDTIHEQLEENQGLKRKCEAQQKEIDEHKKHKAAQEAEIKRKNNKLAEAQKERNEHVASSDKYQEERDNYKEKLRKMTDSMPAALESQMKYVQLSGNEDDDEKVAHVLDGDKGDDDDEDE